MGRKHREKKMSDKEAEENLTAKLVETGYREELKKKVREDQSLETHSRRKLAVKLTLFPCVESRHLFDFLLSV